MMPDNKQLQGHWHAAPSVWSYESAVVLLGCSGLGRAWVRVQVCSTWLCCGTSISQGCALSRAVMEHRKPSHTVASTFKVSAHSTSPPVPLAKANHVIKPNISGEEKSTGRSWRITWQRARVSITEREWRLEKNPTDLSRMPRIQRISACFKILSVGVNYVALWL